jgi:hypothetical protein
MKPTSTDEAPKHRLTGGQANALRRRSTPSFFR